VVAEIASVPLSLPDKLVAVTVVALTVSGPFKTEAVRQG
jgi:hypothetical protein